MITFPNVGVVEFISATNASFNEFSKDVANLSLSVAPLTPIFDAVEFDIVTELSIVAEYSVLLFATSLIVLVAGELASKSHVIFILLNPASVEAPEPIKYCTSCPLVLISVILEASTGWVVVV